MGFLGTIPAAKLTAVYNYDIQELTLTAEGVIQEATYGYEFQRIPWAGGLAFKLEAWTGPLTGKSAPYSYTQKFHLALPNGINAVIIFDANHPKGVPVSIQFEGIVIPKQSSSNGSSSAAPAAQLQGEVKEVASPAADVINVLYGENFTIKQNADLPKFGSIDLKFDTNFLTLETAGISDGSITWTFKSLQTGNTQVVVTVYGGIAAYVLSVVHDVKVFFPYQGPGPVINSKGVATSQVKTLNGASKLSPSAASTNGASADEILSFLGRVNIARNIVRATWPDAQLYNVQAMTNNPKGATFPWELGLMTVMFRIQDAVVTLISTGFGEFGPPHVRPGGIIGNDNIDWPVSMDANEANQLLRDHGYHGRYSNLTLRKPLYPGMQQNCYIFAMEDGMQIYVGTKDKKVTP